MSLSEIQDRIAKEEARSGHASSCQQQAQQNGRAWWQRIGKAVRTRMLPPPVDVQLPGRSVLC